MNGLQKNIYGFSPKNQQVLIILKMFATREIW